MGEENAGVNLIAEDRDGEDEGEDEDEDKDEYEDEGWWIGTVGVMEMPDQVEEGPGYPPSDCSADEAAEDEWWSLGPIRPNPGRGGAGAQRPGAPQSPPGNTARVPCPVSAKRRKLRKRPETTLDRDWEEARRNAWLRQMLSDTSSDEDEERYWRFAESGRWMTELFEIPQQPAPTSGGECFG
jgi:hypothetical protein